MQAEQAAQTDPAATTAGVPATTDMPATTDSAATAATAATTGSTATAATARVAPAAAPGAAGAAAADPAGRTAVRMTAWVRGRVQGVGFRWFTRANALRIGGLEGFAVNLGDGRVQVLAEGERHRCEQLLTWLSAGDTPGRVDGVTEIWGEPRGGYDGFAIR